MRRLKQFVFSFFSFSLLPCCAIAAVPEPDNILYGTIALNNIPIPALRSDITIEARLLINGPAIARYRMGDTAKLGDFYSLRIPLESASTGNSNVTSVGTGLFIVVIDNTGVRAQATVTVGNRATVRRLDLGAAAAGDADILPDDWETLIFGDLSQTPDSVNANGQTTLQNYVAGTNPHDTNSVFAVSVSSEGGNLKMVSFKAVRVSSIGYPNLNRHYSLEYCTNIGSGIWFGADGFTDLLGNDQVITYQILQTNNPVIYRAKVWLEGP